LSAIQRYGFAQAAHDGRRTDGADSSQVRVRRQKGAGLLKDRFEDGS
jgi:hypothetical protein